MQKFLYQQQINSDLFKTLDFHFFALVGAGIYSENEKVRITQIHLCNATKGT